jgi:hypothetical protein
MRPLEFAKLKRANAGDRELVAHPNGDHYGRDRPSLIV